MNESALGREGGGEASEALCLDPLWPFCDARGNGLKTIALCVKTWS